MQYKRVGRTGLKISEITLGTMIFGKQVNEDDQKDIYQTSSFHNFLYFSSGSKAEGMTLTFMSTSPKLRWAR